MGKSDQLPAIARQRPYYRTLEAGRTYYWCACGRSKSQPFCDGSHKGTGIEPVPYTAGASDTEALFCACKRTADAPFCDGAHNNLPGGYPLDDPMSDHNRAIPNVHGHERIHLDGQCYVARIDELPRKTHGALRYATVIGALFGAVHQSQFVFDIAAPDGLCPPIYFGDRQVLLFVGAGHGQVVIGGKTFDASLHGGLLVHPNERFRLVPAADAPLRVFASVCPGALAPVFESAAELAQPFNTAYPQRAVGIDGDQRVSMGARFFQVLLGEAQGCEAATQFIGEIPLSKAAPHRHLYEESLIVVSGHGVMWTDTRKTEVRAGDVIFLPGKERHSLQCTDANGMLVAGVIHPGTNPSISY